ncbi:PKD repeat protein/glucose/arabinose dehydrogenase/type 1 glutamine amidotransferase [Kibdelosporangium banguiense]|uniref:PKD repeat protein/glucose/arabinose dehydrogenase/type 1 glutamine amidotransferase n=1 Tax=Kibdelosporangium banguiense TaxID=1365924 RepID=A0ABS4TQD0_9PSEU|nr:ThuA domain-containing protein [Kibdelosporangium banguiense]MBP2326184.1 PKD repeat protein/glucose/arabinose dehydrogenase/type 1 glutamine amidotransferase [Kibdelosporangium banguiense]
MRSSLRRRLLAGAATLALATSLTSVTVTPAVAADEPLTVQENGPAALRSDARRPASFRVLVFHKTDGVRRPSITDGVQTIRQLAQNNGFQVTATQDAGAFTPENLAKFRAVVFLNTVGNVLNPAQESAFEGYIRAGGGYVGVHAAAETEPDWQFYQDLVGTKVTGVSGVSTGNVQVADRAHPSTETVARTLTLTEEWYNFAKNVRGSEHVLATVDERSFSGGTMGFDHPISWCQDHVGGRSWYTGLGHSIESYRANNFRKHLLGGITWAAGVVEGDCGATVLGNYEKVTLNDEPGEPMSLAVLPDGRVLHNTRGGEIRMYDPKTGASPVINTIPVYSHDEDGLQTLAIDPDFATNKWVYVYYAPPLNTPVDNPATPGVNEGDAPATSNDPKAWDAFKGYNQLSRFKLVDGPSPRLDMASEQQIIRVDVDRGICCHVAGKVKFDGKGQLYLITGDDTNASGSDGFTPINDAPTQGPGYDAQRSAGNTNDLRGKLLRIKVRPNGTYTIPVGNLFNEAEDFDNKTRPEIFLMGLRNPFRFDVDKSGMVYVGDYSPDSRTSSPTRGPEGTGRWFATRTAGNYGWPFCVQPSLPYVDFDFTTRTPGQTFNCGAPVNLSPRNTGRTTLPAVQQAQFWYTYEARTPCPGSYLQNPPIPCDFKWPVIGTGGVGPHGGPIYSYDSASTSATKFPEYYQDSVVFGEFTRDKLFMMRTDGKGNLVGVEQFLPGFVFDNPMEMEFGPDGNLYVLEYGDGFFRPNPDAQLSVIRYVKGTRSPVAVLNATPTSGQAPLTVQFSSEGSYDPDPGESISYAWDFTNDGTVDSADPNASFTYSANGVYTAKLTVTDSSGKTAVLTRTITVGNTAPSVTVTAPIPGTFFNWGDSIPFTVNVTDPEDGPIDCNRVTVTFVLGHDEHGHGQGSTTGCTGSLTAPADGGDHAGGYLYGGISASYTDLGANGQPALTTISQSVVQTRRQQAEYAQARQGVDTTLTNDTGGGLHLTAIEPGDYAAFDPVNLGGINNVTFRYAGGSAGTVGAPRATVELRLDSPTGPLVATATLAATAGNTTWASQSVPVGQPAGKHRLYLVFGSVPGGPATGLINLNWVEFTG